MAERRRPVWLRYVLVPGWSDHPAEIEGVAKFAAGLGVVRRVDVLPFHQMGRYKWDALKLDYRLRDNVNGIAVIHSLRARFGRDIPAVIISGESSAEELAQIKASGLPMLHKPVRPAKLRSVIFFLLGEAKAPA